MIGLLILLLKPALLRGDGGPRKLHHSAAALIAWPMGMLIAHTTGAAVAGFPDYFLFLEIAKKLNRVSPGHIKIIG